MGAGRHGPQGKVRRAASARNRARENRRAANPRNDFFTVKRGEAGMRIKDITLSWFRGAADSVSMEPNCKSIVVYGENASGKSTFVDAIEYVLNGGRVGHLAHEYSGKNLKKAIPNTHKPKGSKAEFSINFGDKSGVKIEIKDDGSATASGSMAAALHGWDYRRTVLRQDEVVSFIQNTKGEKYSALLPLFGLQPMEI